MYFSINSTIELPIIIPSENKLIFLAEDLFFIPKPTATGTFFFETCLIFFTLFFIELIFLIDVPVIPLIDT